MPVALAEKGAAPADPDLAPMAPAWEPPPVLLPPLAVLPAVLNPGTAVAQSGIDALLAWFEQERQIAPAASLAITSIGGGPGDAAQAAVTLARSYAGRGRRTIVIDACPGNSWFPVIGGAGSGPGLSDLVSGKADFTRVIARDQRSTAHILRFGGDNSIQGRNLIAERLGAVLAALGQSYDTVVIHCGEAVQETPALIRASGATIFLAPATRLADVTAAIAALRAAGYARVAHAVIGQTATPATAVNFPQFAATA